MNRNELERNLLLASSGELAPEACRALDAYLAAHPEVAALDRDWRRLQEAARASLPAGEPGAGALIAIRAAATAEIDPDSRAHRPARVAPARPLRGLAWAASLVLVLGAWAVFAPNHHEDRIAQVHAIAVMARGQTQAEAPASSGDSEAQLRALAQQLLQMEGMMTDEVADESASGDGATPNGEPAPTAFQPRSIRGPLARTCA